MKKESKVELTEKFVFEALKHEGSGHDWWHIHRVAEMARTIATNENADIFICEMAALLHDLADEKVVGNEQKGIEQIRDWLKSIEMDAHQIAQIIEIITTMSFKGGGQPPMATLEGKVVQDADRLDAIGAIGIARAFVFSGAKGQIIYEPELKPKENMSKQEYIRRETTAINHFYEKLLKVKDLMNTYYGKQLAEKRHAYMELYLKEFYEEWDGIR